MFKYHCLNPIAKVGLDRFTPDYTKTNEIAEAVLRCMRWISRRIFWR